MSPAEARLEGSPADGGPGAARAFAALSQPGRLAVFLQILAAGPSGAPLDRLGRDLAMPGSALTLHLRTLETAGLIATLQRARSAGAPVVVAEIERCRAIADWLRACDVRGGWPAPPPEPLR